MGWIAGAHGVRGGIKVQPVSAAPDALLGHATWWVRSRDGAPWRQCRTIAGRMHSGALVAQLEGVATREQAQALRGSEIGVPRSALPPAEKNEIYWDDLAGLEVRNREGVVLGTVTDVVAHGAHPLLRVARPAAAPGPERLIPYVAAIVDRVDLAARRIDVDWGESF